MSDLLGELLHQPTPVVTVTLSRDDARILRAALEKARSAFDADAGLHRRLTARQAEVNALGWSRECARLAEGLAPATLGRSVVIR